MIVVFSSLLLSLGLITFFYLRTKHIDTVCTQSIIDEFETEAWGEGKELNESQQIFLDGVKLIYLQEKHRQCIDQHKFFILF